MYCGITYMFSISRPHIYCTFGNVEFSPLKAVTEALHMTILKEDGLDATDES